MRALIETPADLGNLVERVRRGAGLTQRELADRLGISQRYISELESGKAKRIDDHYFRVLALLGITLNAEFDRPHRVD
ncbi:MAG: putative transcriptional regulator [Schumannella sp.]|nr:putative transcriptional regulator [Schumannella sp.]